MFLSSCTSDSCAFFIHRVLETPLTTVDVIEVFISYFVLIIIIYFMLKILK